MVKSCVGVDIGNARIKMVEIRRKGRGLQVVKLGEVVTPDSAVRRGKVLSEDVLATTLRSLKQELGISSDYVVVGITSQDIVVKQTKFPTMGAKDLAQVLEFELKDILRLSFNALDEVAYSYEEFARTEEEVEVLVTGCQRSLINPYISALTQAGLAPSVIDIHAFALPRVLKDVEKPCLVDIGANQTSIYSESNGVFSAYRILPIGGDQITEGVMEAFEIGKLKAEEYKKEKTLDSLLQDGTGPKGLIRTTVQQLVDGIMQTLDFIRAKERGSSVNEVIDTVFISGGTVSIQGLLEIISTESEIPTERLDPFAEITFTDQSMVPEDPWTFASAVGLALRGLQDED